MKRTAEGLEGRKVWFRTMTGKLMTGTVDAASDVTGLVWVETDSGTMVTSFGSIETVGQAHRGLSARMQMGRRAA